MGRAALGHAVGGRAVRGRAVQGQALRVLSVRGRALWHQGLPGAWPEAKWEKLRLVLPPLPSLLSFLMAAVLAGCGLFANENDLPGEEKMPERSIQEVQEAFTPEWMELPGVVGTGLALCDGEPCIRVFLSRDSPVARAAIPEEVEGYPVELVITGPFEPRGPPGGSGPQGHP